MSMERVAITGSSGFYGKAVIEALRRSRPQVEILGLDVVQPTESAPDRFERCDVLSPDVERLLQEFRPDTVVHLAFIVNPIRDESRMHAVNVDGTQNVLTAATNVGAVRVLVSSSATAYGAWDDNPVPMTEDHPLRARAEYRYADDKVHVERMLKEFADEHPEIAVSWTRPCMIYGPGLTNYLTEFIVKGPLIALPGSNNTPLQFIHLEDVADASVAILTANARGAFNLAPSDWFTLRDLGRWSGRRCLPVPMQACLLFTKIWWGLRLPFFNFPSGLWYFIRYPWVVAPQRLEREIGFRCRRSSRDVITQLLKDSGKLVADLESALDLNDRRSTEMASQVSGPKMMSRCSDSEAKSNRE